MTWTSSLLTKPWQGRVGQAGATAVALSIANFRPLADVGIPALVAAVAHVEALMAGFFPSDVKYDRVEWLTVCGFLPRCGEGGMRRSAARLMQRLRAGDLELKDGVWVEIYLASGIATSTTPSATKWDV